MHSSRQRLLLLNPPAPDAVFRDCYCSGYSKAGLTVHPLDLQIQSGFFQDDEFEVAFLDAIHEGLSAAQAQERIRSFQPDAVLALVGDVVLAHDARFLGEVKTHRPQVRLFASGDIARFSPQEALEWIPALEGILMDFTSPSLLAHLRGEPSHHLLLRDRRMADASPLEGTFRHPLPRQNVVKKYRRRLPFFRAPQYYSLATSYGCPYSCRYCNAHRVGYRTRPIEDVLAELRFAAELGYRSLYVRDATFFFDRHRTRQLLHAWEEARLHFEWICFSRPDLIDEEIAGAAAKLGCRLVMLGIESHDERCLKSLARDVPAQAITRAFRILREQGVPTAAQFIAGLRGLGPNGRLPPIDEYEPELLQFIAMLDPDHISLGVYHARPGTQRDSLLLSPLERDRRACERLAQRVTRRFYAAPRRAFRRAAAVRSLAQFAFQARTAARLVFPPRCADPRGDRT